MGEVMGTSNTAAGRATKGSSLLADETTDGDGTTKECSEREFPYPGCDGSYKRHSSPGDMDDCLPRFMTLKSLIRTRASQGSCGRTYYPGLARLAAHFAARRSISYRELFGRAFDAILLVDPESGTIIDVNAAACALYGQSRQALIGGSPFSRSQTPGRLADLVTELRRGGEPAFFIVDRRLDGAELSLEVRGTLVRHRGRELVMTFHRDVTEKAAMTRQLASAAGEWQLTVDSIQAAIILVDSGGAVLRMNEMAAAVAGEDAATLTGRRLADLTGEPWSRAAELVAFVSDHGLPLSSQVDDPFSGATWDVAATVATSSSGEQRVILVMRDVTLIASLESSLRRSETMAEMGRLVSGVAHEVRNPLFTISATLDAFEKRRLDSASTAADPYFQHLREAIGRLSTLMRELLELGKPSTLQVSTESVAGVVSDAVADVAPLAARKGIPILNRVTEESGKILMDRGKLAQALSNLVENAVHHSPAGESVLISAHRKQIQGQTWVVCTVEDRGAGFAEADLPRLFEPFFTKRKGGTGLGLSIVQRIVQHHGGRVLAENRAGGGASLTLMFPHLGGGEKDVTEE